MNVGLRFVRSLHGSSTNVASLRGPLWSVVRRPWSVMLRVVLGIA